jgi:hypothetical protein
VTPPKKAALQIIVVGVIFSVVAFVANGLLGDTNPRVARMFANAISLGNAIVVLGAIRLAIAKGHRWYVGLLGILNLVGVAILWFVVTDKDVRAPKT